MLQHPHPRKTIIKASSTTINVKMKTEYNYTLQCPGVLLRFSPSGVRPRTGGATSSVIVSPTQLYLDHVAPNRF